MGRKSSVWVRGHYRHAHGRRIWVNGYYRNWPGEGIQEYTSRDLRRGCDTAKQSALLIRKTI